MSFITNLCCVKGHVGEVLIAVPVACVFTAASGVLNGTAVVPVAFRARVFLSYPTCRVFMVVSKLFFRPK